MSVSSARIKPLQDPSRDAAPPKPAAYAGPALDSGRLVAAAERHQRQIWSAVGLIVVALLIASGIYITKQRRLAADNVALAHAFALLEARIDEETPAAIKEGKAEDDKDARNEARRNEHEDEHPHFATLAERNEAAYAAFVAAIPALSSKSLSTLAEMMAGNLEVELDKPDAARKRFELLIERLAPEETLGALARMRLAYVLEAQQARKEALEILTPLTDEQRSHFADEASLMRARLLAAEGDVQLARLTLEQVRSRSSNQALAEEARIALAALNEGGQQPVDAAGKDAAPKASSP